MKPLFIHEIGSCIKPVDQVPNTDLMSRWYDPKVSTYSDNFFFARRPQFGRGWRHDGRSWLVPCSLVSFAVDEWLQVSGKIRSSVVRTRRNIQRERKTKITTYHWSKFVRVSTFPRFGEWPFVLGREVFQSHRQQNSCLAPDRQVLVEMLIWTEAQSCLRNHVLASDLFKSLLSCLLTAASFWSLYCFSCIHRKITKSWSSDAWATVYVLASTESRVFSINNCLLYRIVGVKLRES